MSSKFNGLTAWREKQRLEREWRLARLAELREDAETVVRDGREFKLVRIPDGYERSMQERVEPPVKLRRVRSKR